MVSTHLLVTAVLLWTLGASVYTWELWTARGLTDNGFLGLAALMVGSLTMAYALDAHPTLGVCTLLPGLLAALVMVHKAWMRFLNLLRRQAREREARDRQAVERSEAMRQGIARSEFWTPGAAESRPLPEPVRVPDVEAEEERSRRLGKMFG